MIPIPSTASLVAQASLCVATVVIVVVTSVAVIQALSSEKKGRFDREANRLYAHWAKTPGANKDVQIISDGLAGRPMIFRKSRFLTPSKVAELVENTISKGAAYELDPINGVVNSKLRDSRRYACQKSELTDRIDRRIRIMLNLPSSVDNESSSGGSCELLRYIAGRHSVGVVRHTDFVYPSETRRFTALIYLTTHTMEQGGSTVFYTNQHRSNRQQDTITIQPVAGDLVVFRVSDRETGTLKDKCADHSGKPVVKGHDKIIAQMFF